MLLQNSSVFIKCFQSNNLNPACIKAFSLYVQIALYECLPAGRSDQIKPLKYCVQSVFEKIYK